MANQYKPKVNDVVFARRKDLQTSVAYDDVVWYRFLVTYINEEDDYIGMESLGQCDDYDGEASILEYKKDPNQKRD